MKRRPLRLIAAALASAALLLLAGALLFRVHSQRRLDAAETRFLDQAGPLEPAAYAPAAVREPANIAAWMKAGAAALLMEGEDRHLLAELDDRPVSQWSAPERRRIEAVLGELRPALELLHRGAELSDSSFGLHYAAGPTMPIPSEGGVQLLRASSLLAIECRLALARSDLEGALRSARGVERIAAALGHEPILLLSILAETVTHRYLLLLRSILESDPPESVLAGLAADLHHREALCEPLARAVAFDGTGAYHAWLQGVFQGRIDLRLFATSRFLGPLIAARTLEAYLELVRLAKIPDLLADLPSEPPAKVRPWDLHLLLMPNFTDALLRDKATASALELARLAIQARRVALLEGRYPDSPGAMAFIQSLPSALSGEAVLLEPTASGGIRLAYPEAKRLLEEREASEARRADLLDWVLPPLSP